MILLSLHLSAQNRIPTYVRKQESKEWYEQKIKEIEKDVQSQPTNSVYWYNLFIATRSIQIIDRTHHSDASNVVLQKILDRAKPHIGGSLDYLLCKKYLLKSYTKEYLACVEQIEKLDPDNIDAIEGKAVHYEITGQLKKSTEAYIRLYELKKYPHKMLEYSYNLLQSVEQGGILFTNGDYDTFPLRLLQEAKGVRKDVILLNTSLARSFNYLEANLERAEVKITSEEFDKLSKETAYPKAIIEFVWKKKSRLPVYFSLTHKVQGIEDKDLYCTGLALKYSTEKINNIPLLKSNFEKNYRLDYITLAFYADVDHTGWDHRLNRWNANYLVGLLSLHDYYYQKGEKTTASSWEELAMLIADKADMKQQVEEHFKAH